MTIFVVTTAVADAYRKRLVNEGASAPLPPTKRELPGAVSVVSWSAYLLSALLWFVYGLRQRDKNIYLPCIGWIGLDVAVVAGAILFAPN